ncbi:MAG: monovalent cation/H+ antiporter complex subunit F [Gaiellaceae bacterium]|jgi:multisubunit Na+/H+ antiporter MnhF subunit
MSVFLIAATVLLLAMLLPGIVCVRAHPIDAVVAVQLCGTLATLTFLCLAEGFHRGIYFNVALVSAATTWIGSLVFARFFGRVL